MTGNLAAILFPLALIAAVVVRYRVMRRREEAAWRKWMRDTDQAIDNVREPAAGDFARPDRELHGGAR